MAATLFTLHYMSLSVICAAISCPITLALFGADTLWTVLLCTLGVLLLIWRHKGNIRRLLDGTEPKFSFRDSGSQPTCARTAEK
jgi:glycerol-3-phosphate acyltransferase PlsY